MIAVHLLSVSVYASARTNRSFIQMTRHDHVQRCCLQFYFSFSGVAASAEIAFDSSPSSSSSPPRQSIMLVAYRLRRCVAFDLQAFCALLARCALASFSLFSIVWNVFIRVSCRWFVGIRVHLPLHFVHSNGWCARFYHSFNQIYRLFCVFCFDEQTKKCNSRALACINFVVVFYEFHAVSFDSNWMTFVCAPVDRRLFK